MPNRVITTKLNDKILTFLLDERDQILEVDVHGGQSLQVGDLYIGRVEQIKPNINSCFVNIGSENVFVSLLDNRHVFYAKRISEKKIVSQGDEILVQIEKEAHKTKLAKGTTDFTLTGKYILLTTDKDQVFISSKIRSSKIRKQLTQLVSPYICDAYGFIIRTDAENADPASIKAEINNLIEQYKSLIGKIPYRSGQQILLRQNKGHASVIFNQYLSQTEGFYYDDESLYQEAIDAASDIIDFPLEKIHLKEQQSGTYLELYNLRKKLHRLMVPKVWLKSGGSIIIEPTEALTVIDVNTEKSMVKKNQADTLLATNLEAAKAIMREIRARNISGIIIVDFIDMTKEHHNASLLSELRQLAKEDPIKLTIVGMTKLGLVEMTRKKLHPPLWEKLDSKTGI